jgi:hypothetical protein
MGNSSKEATLCASQTSFFQTCVAAPGPSSCVGVLSNPPYVLCSVAAASKPVNNNKRRRTTMIPVTIMKKAIGKYGMCSATFRFVSTKCSFSAFVDRHDAVQVCLIPVVPSCGMHYCAQRSYWRRWRVPGAPSKPGLIS